MVLADELGVADELAVVDELGVDDDATGVAEGELVDVDDGGFEVAVTVVEELAPAGTAVSAGCRTINAVTNATLITTNPPMATFGP